MDDHQTQDLVEELVHRLLSAGAGGGRDEAGALKFAHRLLSSRLAPAVLPDEHAVAESIKRRLAASGRPNDALAFADIHSKLSARTRPASLWPLLYLLDLLSSQRRAAAAASCLPNLPTAAPPRTAAAQSAGGRPGTDAQAPEAQAPGRMLTCIACSKQQFAAGGAPLHDPPVDEDAVDAGVGVGVSGAATPGTRHAIKALTAQIKDMALKASGAYRHCKPCAGSSAAASRRHHPYHHRGGSGFGGSDAGSGSERFHYAYRRAGSSAASTPRLRSGVAAFSSGDVTPSTSVRTDFPAGDEEDDEEMSSGCGGGDGKEDAKEWVAQVEPGVLITFVSLAQGGNDLKRIRFSREMFDKWQAQRWWSENYDKVMELYNVQKFNQAAPLPTTPKSEDESSKDDSPVTPPLDKERLPRTFHRPLSGGGASSSDSLEHHCCNGHHHGHQCYDSMGLVSTPKLSSISAAKTETSSMDASMRTSSSPEEADRSGELSVSISNASDQEREWVQEDEPGVYITIRALPGGVRELRRVRFSREKFSEMHARLWWEENRARIHEQYL